MKGEAAEVSACMGLAATNMMDLGASIATIAVHRVASPARSAHKPLCKKLPRGSVAYWARNRQFPPGSCHMRTSIV
jgi:hypothetical protein